MELLVIITVDVLQRNAQPH